MPIRSNPIRPTPPAHPNRAHLQEWPHNWPNFISDIVSFSQTSEVLCENNIRILKLLSEGACASSVSVFFGRATFKYGFRIELNLTLSVPSPQPTTEVFDFSKDQMTTAKIRTMKDSLNVEFSKIFQLCDFILARSQRPSLIKATLQTLQRFLTWIPLGFIFETSLIQSLVEQFFIVPAFRVETLECLTEIASLQVRTLA